MDLLAERGVELVRLNVERSCILILDQVVLFEGQFGVVNGRGELLPMINIKLLQAGLVYR